MRKLYHAVSGFIPFRLPAAAATVILSCSTVLTV